MTKRRTWKAPSVLAALGLALAVGFIGCDNPAGGANDTRLPAPVISIAAGTSTVSWAAVSGATGYSVRAGGSTVTGGTLGAEATSFNLAIANLPQGTHQITVVAHHGNPSLDSLPSNQVPFTVVPGAAPQLGIALSTTGHVFPSADGGYTVGAGQGNVNPLTVTITNTGTEATGALNIALSGTNAASFALLASSVSSIAVAGSDTFTVAPNPGLAFGNYSATVTVSRAEGSMATASFTVSFTVTNPDAPALAAPAIALHGSMLSWNPIANATGYHVFAGDSLIGEPTGTSFDLAGANLPGGTHQITVVAFGNPATHNPSPRSNALPFTVGQATQPDPQTLNLTGQMWQIDWDSYTFERFTGNIPNIISELGGSGAVTGGQLNFTIGPPPANTRLPLSEVFGGEEAEYMFYNFTITPSTAIGSVLEGLNAPDDLWISRGYLGESIWEHVIYIFVEQNVVVSGVGRMIQRNCECPDCDCEEWDGACFCHRTITTTSFNITLTPGWNPLHTLRTATEGNGGGFAETVTVSRNDPANLKWVLDGNAGEPVDPGPSDPPWQAPGPGEPLILSGQVWTLDFETWQSSKFTGNVPNLGGGTVGGGEITDGQLSYTALAYYYSLWCMSDLSVSLGIGNASFSDNEAMGISLFIMSNGLDGNITSEYFVSFNVQGDTTTAVVESVTYIFVDRPVTVSSSGWKYSGGGNDNSDDDDYSIRSGNAFSITLNQGWNPVHQRTEITMSDTLFSMNVVSTTIANPSHIRWYWWAWPSGWCGCSDGDCQYFGGCPWCEGECNSSDCQCSTTVFRPFSEGTGGRSMRAVPGRPWVSPLRVC